MSEIFASYENEYETYLQQLCTLIRSAQINKSDDALREINQLLEDLQNCLQQMDIESTSVAASGRSILKGKVKGYKGELESMRKQVLVLEEEISSQKAKGNLFGEQDNQQRKFLKTDKKLIQQSLQLSDARDGVYNRKQESNNQNNDNNSEEDGNQDESQNIEEQEDDYDDEEDEIEHIVVAKKKIQQSLQLQDARNGVYNRTQESNKQNNYNKSEEDDNQDESQNIEEQENDYDDEEDDNQDESQILEEQENNYDDEEDEIEPIVVAKQKIQQSLQLQDARDGVYNRKQESNKQNNYNKSQEDDNQDESQNIEEQEDDYDDEDYDIEHRVEAKSKLKPRLSEAAFRMLSTNIRRIDPTLPRGVAQRTQRNEEGKRIEVRRIEQYQPKDTTNSKEISNLRTVNIVASLRERYLAMKQQAIQIQDSQVKQDNFTQQPPTFLPQKNQLQFKQVQNIDQSQSLLYNCEQQWRSFAFTDNMCTPSNIADASNLRLYDGTFEVDENFQLDISLIVKPFVRSNQGKEETVLRSDLGMVKSLRRLHSIFNERGTKKEDGRLVDIVDIFQYIADRFRALNTELKQIESKNSNIFIFRIQYLEQLIRIYLLSYIEMMRADQNIDEIKQNKKNCKQQLIEALDDLMIDYSLLFHELNQERLYLLDNLPEFIQYYYLMLTLSILSTESIQKIANLDYIIYSEFIFSQQLIKTSEYQFCKIIQECMILKNFTKIFILCQTNETSIFQQCFIYLLQEKIQELMESSKYQSGLTGSKIKLEQISIQHIYEKMSKIPDIIQVINYKGRFSSYVLGKESIQPLKQDQIATQPKIQQKHPTKIKNILIEIGKKLILRNITNFLAPHFQQVEVQLGQFYMLLRTLKHWKLYTYKKQRMRRFKQLCNIECQKKQPMLNQQLSFISQLAEKFLDQMKNTQKFYYKIAIFDNTKGAVPSIVNRVIFSLCEKASQEHNDSLIIESHISYKQKDYNLFISIQILKSKQAERLCGTDLYIVLGENNDYLKGQPCFQILLPQQSSDMENEKCVVINYEYIELFDNYYESYDYNQKLTQAVDLSLKNKKQIDDLELFSLPNFFKEIKSINLGLFESTTVEYFIAKCVLAEICLESTLKNNFHSDELPQELLFDRFVNQESILKYVTKFNPGNQLMIPLCNKLRQNYTTESDFINDIKYYLEDYVDEELLLKLLRKHFVFGVSCRGDWHLLFEFIIDQLIAYLEETDIYFVVPKNYKIIIDEQQLNVRIQKDIKQLLNKSSYQQKIEVQTPQPCIRNKIFRQDLKDWVQKKMCK